MPVADCLICNQLNGKDGRAGLNLMKDMVHRTLSVVPLFRRQWCPARAQPDRRPPDEASPTSTGVNDPTCRPETLGPTTVSPAYIKDLQGALRYTP